MEEKFKMLLHLIGKLERGCECEYDYRCRSCNAVIAAKEFALQCEKEVK